jgi:sialic acid synthase
MIIDGTALGDDCYVIAEVGHNHQGNVKTCMEIFEAAAWAGCNAVKLQKRDNKTLYTDEMYNSPYNSENAFGPTYGLHREALEFDGRQYRLLKTFAESLGLTFLATAFDIPSAQFLGELGIAAFKIASGDITNKPLFEMVKSFGKPVIFSTGGSTEDQIEAASEWLGGCCHAILHCTSGYPAKYGELNLRVIPTLAKKFPDKIIGWSAHDTGIAMAPVAYALGARIIEKHFTLNRAWKGTDQSFSLEPQGMKAMIDNLRQCKESLGDGQKRVFDSEAAPLTKQRKNKDGRVDGRTVS